MTNSDSSEGETYRRIRAHRKELDRRQTRAVRHPIIVDASRKAPNPGKTTASLWKVEREL